MRHQAIKIASTITKGRIAGRWHPLFTIKLIYNQNQIDRFFCIWKFISIGQSIGWKWITMDVRKRLVLTENYNIEMPELKKYLREMNCLVLFCFVFWVALGEFKLFIVTDYISFVLFLYLFICVYIVWATSSLCPPTPYCF
jgi:hypothetical protein